MLRTVRWSWSGGVALGLALVTFGWLSTPGVHPVSAAGAYLILLVYGALGYGLIPRLHHLDSHLFGWIGWFGLLAGAIFLGEMALEYLLLPADNTRWGQIEYGTTFLLFFSAGLVAAFRTNRFGHGIAAGFGSALLASLVFILLILSFFYAFRGTPQQALVFQAEGNYADFAVSRMHDFNVFVMEDFFGAVFFHSLLLPLSGALLGALGGLSGKGLAWLGNRALSRKPG